MKKMVVRVLVFLLIGAVVTTSIAWGRLLIPPVDLSMGETGAVYEGANWPAAAPSDWPAPRRHEWTERFAYRVDWALAAPEPDSWWFYGVRAGWPCLALTAREYSHWQGDHMVSFESPVERGVQFRKMDPSSHRLDGCLPVFPVWPGFALDTAIYASCAWGCVALYAWVNARKRIRHGLCPHCVYPIGPFPVCTECGKRVIPIPSVSK